MARERLVTQGRTDVDEGQDRASPHVATQLRPKRLGELIGQEKVLSRLRIAIQAAQGRREPLEHVLLSGPPGLGKTTLANVIASEMGAPLRVTSGPSLPRTGDLMTFLFSLQPGEVLFIDEIHRLPATVEEFLYPAMEDLRVDYSSEQGLGSAKQSFQLEPFTLIGATTRKGLLTGPLRDRFGLQFEFEFYDTDELERIATRSAELLGCRAEPGALRRIAERSRGTPRIVNRLLRRVRDYAAVKANGVLRVGVVDEALSVEEIDELGLDPLDRRFLRTLIEVYDGGPAGIEAIAASMGQERDTLEDTVEPFLLQIGFVRRTQKGRQITARAVQHMKLPPRTGVLF